MLDLAHEAAAAGEAATYQPVGDAKRSAARPWVTSWWKRMPYSAVAALLGVVILTLASIAVLAASNGAPIDDWSILNVKFQPQVWVAVMSVVSNALLGYAFAEGVAIQFWRHACRGTTLQYLHDSYESMALMPALGVLGRRRLNVVAIASLMVSVSLVRGPLFQRASTVTTAFHDLTGVTTLRAAQIIPYGYTTKSRDDDGLESPMSPEFKDVVQNMTSTLSIPYPNTGCPGRCRARVKAAGWKVDCSSTSEPFGLSDEERTARAAALGCAAYNRAGMTATPTVSTSPTAAILANSDAQASAAAAAAAENVTHCRYHEAVGATDVFRTGFVRGRRNLTLHTLAKTFAGCGGADDTGNAGGSGVNSTRPSIISRACTLTLGVVDYAVELTPDSVALLKQQRPPPAAAHKRDVGEQDEDGAAASGDDDEDRYLGDVGLGETYYAATYAYLMLFPPVRVLFEWRMGRATPVPERRVNCPGAGTFAANVTCSEKAEEAKIRDTSLMFMTPLEWDSRPAAMRDRCQLTWIDPMEEMLRTMRELAFRTSIDAARYTNRSIFMSLAPEDPRVQQRLTANWTQPRIPFTGRQQRTVYRTDWRFAAAAAAASLLCGVLGGVLPLLWGWWQLGRSVSLNPLEVAHAFRAPLLVRDGAVASNAGRAALVRACGAKRVRYGAVVAQPLAPAAAPLSDRAKGEGAEHWPLSAPLRSWPGEFSAASTALGAGSTTGAAKMVLCFDEDGDDDVAVDGYSQSRRRVTKPEPGAMYD